VFRRPVGLNKPSSDRRRIEPTLKIVSELSGSAGRMAVIAAKESTLIWRGPEEIDRSARINALRMRLRPHALQLRAVHGTLRGEPNVPYSQSLRKNAPDVWRVQAAGDITALPLLGGLHHQYVWASAV